MNTIYIVRTMTECVDTFDGDKSHRVCDLDPSTTLFLLLSTPAPTVFAGHVCDTCFVPIVGTITSAAMLGFKLAHVEVLKLKWDEQKRLEAEREALIGELEEALSPELALRVEAIIDRRSSFVMPHGLARAPLPQPAHADGAEDEGRRGSVREMRQSLRKRVLETQPEETVTTHARLTRYCLGASYIARLVQGHAAVEAHPNASDDSTATQVACML
jgi:hypothetical protein